MEGESGLDWDGYKENFRGESKNVIKFYSRFVYILNININIKTENQKDRKTERQKTRKNLFKCLFVQPSTCSPSGTNKYDKKLGCQKCFSLIKDKWLCFLPTQNILITRTLRPTTSILIKAHV